MVGTDKQGKIEELAQRVHEHANRLNKACSRLDIMTDKLYGCIPETCDKSKEDPPFEGKIGQLEQAIYLIGKECSSMVNSIDRLTESGIV